jgi:hypothetical protein
MRKHEAKGKVKDRLKSRYVGSVVAVLVAIIDALKVEDWKTSSIEDVFSRPKTDTDLAFATCLERRTVRRAANILLRDGFIKESPTTNHSYAVNTAQLLTLPSRYVSRRTKALEDRIKNAIRMRFSRWDGLTPAFRWASTHPTPAGDVQMCRCAGFCSHPSTI